MAEASILPNEPTMQEVNNNCNSSFNNINSSFQSESEISIVENIFDVSQVMSMCRTNVKLAAAEELSQCLPLFQIILSDLSEMVAFAQQQQQQPQQTHQSYEDDQKLSFKPTYVKPIVSSYASFSSLASCSSLEDESMETDTGVSNTVGDLFISKLSATIEKFAPGHVFNRKKAQRIRKRKRMSTVPKMFRSLWKHYDTILSPAVPKEPSLTPIVDWSKVNYKALSNLPSPQDIPVYGCSKDQDLYKTRWYSTKHPFGSIPGFRTSLGVISLDKIKEPIHGHVYDPDYGGWVIHASYKEKDVNFNNRKQGKKKLLRKKTGSTHII